MLKLNRKYFDIWTIPILIAVVSFIFFLLYPVISVVKSSLFDGSGRGLSLASYIKFFTVPCYYKALFNTLFLGVCGTLVIMAVCIPLAYFYTRYRIYGRVLIGTALWIPYLTPAFIGAYTWLILFGRFGLITKLFHAVGIMVPSLGGLGGFSPYSSSPTIPWDSFY